MIQRPQTLILLGVFLFSQLMLTGSFARFTVEGSDFLLKHSGLFDADGVKTGMDTWPISVLFFGVAVLTFLNIIFFKHRMRQMRIAIFLILLNAGMVLMMLYYTIVVRNQLETALVLYRWRFIVPPVNMILLYFAFRRIRRDELTVKAFDRIR